jgi:hypothetical protein
VYLNPKARLLAKIFTPCAEGGWLSAAPGGDNAGFLKKKEPKIPRGVYARL